MEKQVALVYMVAGISSRFAGKIKQFAMVTEAETLMEYSLKQAIPAGFTKIIFIVGNKTEQPFKEKFGDSFQGIPVEYALQKYEESKRDRPWGTTDALCSAKELIVDPFVVCNGDDLYGEKSFKTLVQHLKESDEEATLGYELREVIPEQGKTNRGIFEADENNYVQNLKEVFEIEKNKLEEKGLVEKSLCSMNIFALHPKVVNLLSLELEKFKQEHPEDRKSECLLPEELAKFVNNGEIQMKIYPAKDKWMGITNPGDALIIQKNIHNINK